MKGILSREATKEIEIRSLNLLYCDIGSVMNKVINKILLEALQESGWSPLNRRKPDMSLYPQTIEKDVHLDPNGKIQININNNYIFNEEDEQLCDISSSCSEMGDPRISSMGDSRISLCSSPTSDSGKKSMAEKRKERFLRLEQEQAAKRALCKAKPIPEELRLLTRKSPEEVMPLMDLTGFHPYDCCACDPHAVIMCRMCGVQPKSKCFLHQADTSIIAFCCRKCTSRKLVVLKNI